MPGAALLSDALLLPSCLFYFSSSLSRSVAGGCWHGQMWDGRGHAWRRHQQLFRSKATLFAHGWSGLAWEVDGGWRMLGQMWPPKWLVLLCPRGVFSCPFLFHPAPHVVAQGATISSLRDFLLFWGNFALFCVHVCRVCGVFFGGWLFFLLIKFCIL